MDSVTNKEKCHLKNTYTALTCVQIWARRGGAEPCQLKSNRTSLETKKNLIKAKWYVNKAEFTCLNCAGLLEHWMIICHLKQVVYESKYTRKCQRAAIIHTCAVQCWREVCFRGFNAWKKQSDSDKPTQTSATAECLIAAGWKEIKVRGQQVSEAVQVSSLSEWLQITDNVVIGLWVPEGNLLASWWCYSESEWIVSYVNNGIVFVTI